MNTERSVSLAAHAGPHAAAAARHSEPDRGPKCGAALAVPCQTQQALGRQKTARGCCAGARCAGMNVC